MNDDFLYRLRTEPPPHFADALKARLDRRAKRIVRPWPFALGVLLFGAAFATMSYWSREAPTPAVAIPQETQEGLAHAFSDKTAGSPNAGVETAAAPPAPGNDALLDEEQTKRRLPVTLPPLPSAAEASTDAGVDTDSPDAESGFIVTGPLLGEYGTPAYMFETRRAYFTVLEWTLKPLQDMLLKRAPMDQKIARTAAYRLAALTPMISELFAKDERPSNVPTRARSTIWEQRSAFIQESRDFGKAVQGLLVAVKSNDERQLQQAIARVGKACASCHDKFREQGNKDVGAVTP